MHVVIIGAGVSGLSCAARLTQLASSVHVTILEATDRIGGRIKSTAFGITKVDIGASWMHETRYNPLFRTALENGWPMRYTDELNKLCTAKGELPPKSGVPPILRDLESRIRELIDLKHSDEKSLASFVEEQLGRMPMVSDQQKQLISLMIRENEHYIGLPIDEIPTFDGCSHNDLGRDAFMLGKGYQVVIDWLESQIDWHRTNLCTQTAALKVTNAQKKFKIEHQSGVIEADFVVCTIPLGALKSQFAQLFGEVLESPTMRNLSIHAIKSSIEKTSVAQLGKIIVQFESRFWDAYPISSETDSWFVINEQNGDCFTIINPFETDAILVLLMAPPLTEKYEKMSSDDIFPHIRWVFDALVPGEAARQEIDKLVRIYVSDWSQNPYFLGSYSARSLGQDYNQMIDPYIDNTSRLRFAGEHTILEGNGCVHGAYNSGVREAEFIANLVEM